MRLFVGQNVATVVFVVANAYHDIVHETVGCKLAAFHDDGVALFVRDSQSAPQTAHQLYTAPDKAKKKGDDTNEIEDCWIHVNGLIYYRFRRTYSLFLKSEGNCRTRLLKKRSKDVALLAHRRGFGRSYLKTYGWQHHRQEHDTDEHYAIEAVVRLAT